MRRIYCKNYSEWSDEIQKQLQCSNFQHGLMRPTLEGYNPITYVMLDARRLIGWALVLEESINDPNNFAMFFVKQRNRRQGVGTRLANRIRKDYDHIYFEPHDTTSIKFFRAVNLNGDGTIKF